MYQDILTYRFLKVLKHISVWTSAGIMAHRRNTVLNNFCYIFPLWIEQSSVILPWYCKKLFTNDSAWVCKYLFPTMPNVASIIQCLPIVFTHTLDPRQPIIWLPPLFTEIHVSSLKRRVQLARQHTQGLVVLNPVVSGGKFTTPESPWFS